MISFVAPCLLVLAAGRLLLAWLQVGLGAVLLVVAAVLLVGLVDVPYVLVVVLLFLLLLDRRSNSWVLGRLVPVTTVVFSCKSLYSSHTSTARFSLAVHC